MRQQARASRWWCLVVLCGLGWPSLAGAQVSRAAGTIKDADGKPIRGATVVAQNPDASPYTHTATSDGKGRWSMLGLRPGLWVFTASAPGFEPLSGTARIRININLTDLDLQLARASVPLPPPFSGVDLPDIQAKLTGAAEALREGRYDEAIATYQAVVDQVPALGLVHLQIARAFRAKGDYAAALAQCDLAGRSLPGTELVLAETALIHVARHDVAAAEAALAARAGAAWETSPGWFAVGEVALAKGAIDEARRAFERSLGFEPDSILSRLRLATLAAKRGETAVALAHLEAALSAGPTGSEAEEARRLLAQLKK